MISLCANVFPQTDFSDSWEDFFSYNNVKDFVIEQNRIYAIADNAAFIYDMQSGLTEKISSVQGLSGKETSSIHYSSQTERFVIGYQTGLLEIIDKNGKITVAGDIERLDITGQKQINHISENEGILYLSTPFGIVAYNIAELYFEDTFFIDENSSAVFVNETAIYEETLYAVTQKGIYSADLNEPNLIDYNNWTQPQGNLLGNFSSISIIGDAIFTCTSTLLYQLIGADELLQRRNYNKTIRKLKSSERFLTISFDNMALVTDENLLQVYEVMANGEYKFELNTAYALEEDVFLATTNFGILKNAFFDSDFTEIHPEGPLSNQVFSIEARNSHLWVVYGGYNLSYAPLEKKLGYSHYNGAAMGKDLWANRQFDPKFPARDLVNITLPPDDDSTVYLSSWGDGMLVVQNDEPTVLWDDSNSGLEDLYPDGSPESSIRINGASFDNNGNLWISNSWVPERLKKRNANGQWSGYDLSPVITNPAFGLSQLIVDRSGNIWIGSRRNGALVFNESGERKRALITEATKGSLPDLNVRTLAVDRNNRIWIGTQKGLVVFPGGQSVFETDIYDAEPVIVEDNGIPKRLLGDQPVNSIAIDGAENKWFGTDTGGVLATTSSGNETLYNFNKDNSPLPSNSVLKISVDPSNGKVYFATDKGIVAFNSEVVPFGEALDEVYAYPNPVKKEHEFVTIDGRNGTHLPRGTNVKILDISGRLVHETNVEVGQELQGGKVVWNKTNL